MKKYNLVEFFFWQKNAFAIFAIAITRIHLVLSNNRILLCVNQVLFGILKTAFLGSNLGLISSDFFLTFFYQSYTAVKNHYSWFFVVRETKKVGVLIKLTN